jgi:hypothetical protein
VNIPVRKRVIFSQTVTRAGELLPTGYSFGIASHPKKTAKRHLMDRYSFTSKEADEVMDRRKGPCEICGRIPGKLVVDHDHKTDELRGLICQRCNHALHTFDNPDLLEKIKVYIEATPSLKVE